MEISSKKKYVFSELVHNVDDPNQLLAYAIYKAEKQAKATTLKASGKSCAEIKADLQIFHDVVAGSAGIQDGFHLKAKQVAQALVNDIKDAIRKDSKNDFIERVEQLIKTERPWWMSVLSFIGEGLKGVLASIVFIVLFSGIYALTLSKENRKSFIGAVGKTIQDTVYGKLPVIDNYRDVLKNESVGNQS
jgi:hypothetical protein